MFTIMVAIKEGRKRLIKKLCNVDTYDEFEFLESKIEHFYPIGFQIFKGDVSESDCHFDKNWVISRHLDKYPIF